MTDVIAILDREVNERHMLNHPFYQRWNAGELTRGELVKVAWARHQAEAELIQNIILEEGVPSIVRRSAGSDVPDFLAAGPRDVLVPESGAATARTALHQADIEPSQPATADRPSSQHVARVLLAILGGAGIAALIAWALAQAH